jgi:hypothetical protein
MAKGNVGLQPLQTTWKKGFAYRDHAEDRMPKGMLKGRYSIRREGRPCTRWLDNVVTDLVVMGVRSWRRRVRGHSRLEEGCEGCQSLPRAVVVVELSH